MHAGVMITHYHSETAGLVAAEGATVNLQSSEISDNYIYGEKVDSAVVVAYSVNPDLPSSQLPDTVLTLWDTTLLHNYAHHCLLASSNTNERPLYHADVYSDQEHAVYYTDGAETFSVTLPLSDAPADRNGINARSPWRLNQQKVCVSAPTFSTPFAFLDLSVWA